jgi:hypothetical protein
MLNMFSPGVNRRDHDTVPLLSPVVPVVPVEQGSSLSTSQSSGGSYTSSQLNNILESLQSTDIGGLANVIEPLKTLDVHVDSTFLRMCDNPFSRPSTNTNASLQRPLKLAHPSSQVIAYNQLVTLDKIVDVLIKKYQEISAKLSQNDANQDSDGLLETCKLIKECARKIHECLRSHQEVERSFFGDPGLIIDGVGFACKSYYTTRNSGRDHRSTETGEILLHQGQVRCYIYQKINEKIYQRTNEALNPQQPNFELMSPNAS